jgi:Ca2+-binding RTX toxin-like protein
VCQFIIFGGHFQQIENNFANSGAGQLRLFYETPVGRFEMPTSFNINVGDLTHILQQIRIAELHAGTNGAPVSMTEAIRQVYNVDAETAAISPFGLRTVDGRDNNLLPGQSALGAADTLFPRLLDPAYRNDQDGDTMPLGPPGSGAPTITNTNYGAAGSVADADPRIISNLIVSQTNENPAAVRAWHANPLAIEAYQAAHGGALPPVGYIPTNEELAAIPNQSPDIGLSPGFNSWMTFFGQFFDHGLDLVTKGNAGTVYIPLQPDDPLYVAGSATNFMALTRATPTVDANGVTQHQNTTTPFIDQNQTYTSHASHQVFLREYTLNAAGDAVSTGHLLDGQTANGSLDGAVANWAEVKAQALSMLGIRLDDFDVHNVPLLKTDQYGRFIPGANGYAQLVMAPDANHATNWFKEGTAAGITTDGSIGTGHAFLNDIAHHAAPSVVDHDHNPATPKIEQVADDDTLDYNSDGIIDANDLTAGAGVIQDANNDGVIDLLDLKDVNLDGVINARDTVADDRNSTTYDDEMLNAHFVTGDGRGNENIALTAVHSVFHAEHNRLVEANKTTILSSGDLSFINEWLVDPVVTLPVTPAEIDALVWDGERLFQAARFGTEMQYQHLVFEEFARRIQPNVNPFVFTNSADIDPGILAEFAHTVYRFGHSMLTDSVDRLENDLTTVNGDAAQASLIEAFLNPQMFVESGASLETALGAIIRGTTRDVGNEIDEFIVDDVRNNLVGLPLDLAALNIARGRDTGVPSLNDTRAQLYQDFGHADLRPYTGWLDFAQHLKTPMSIVNFIAAYGTHERILTATTNEERRDAALKLVLGDGNNADGVTIRGVTYTNAERVAFLNGSDAYTGGTASGAAGSHGGLNGVDLWIGGLAEEKNEFGGMLGSTFDFIFQYQLEHLQNGDRFYYLSRTQGMNLLNQLEPNTFSDLVMRNTDLGDQYSTHINGALFTTPDHILELDRGIAQAETDPEWDDEFQQIIDPKVARDYTGATTVDVNGVLHDVGGTLTYSGGEHVVLGGTEGNDVLRGDKGIDTLWGDGGDDYLNAGMESDQVFGGDGDDIIEDPFGDDFLRGGKGNDVISGGAGLDILFGEQGQDFIMVGQDDAEVFAGQDNDFVLGGAGNDTLLGNEGSDWIEGGEGFDGIGGDNSQLFFNSQLIGHDVLNGNTNDTDYDGETGDDIMFENAGIQRNNGMAGFDWAIHKDDQQAANSDLGITIGVAQPAFILRDRFDLVEGLSGWKFNDTLTGRNVAVGAVIAGAAVPLNTDILDSFSNALLEKNLGLIDGLDVLTAHLTRTQVTVAGITETIVMSTDAGEDILLGGAGSDVITGRGGNDILDGDKWLNVRIRINDAGGNEIGSADGMTKPVLDLNGVAMFGGRPLSALTLDRTINPGQLQIVREILDGGQVGDVDVAVYWDVVGNYTLTRNADGSASISHTGFNAVTAPATFLSDGVDRLNNIERLRFSDGAGGTVEFSLAQLLNKAPVGVPIISDLTPQEGVLITVDTSGISDPDGLGPLSFQWQTSSNAGTTWVDIGTGGTSNVFTPVDAPNPADSQVGDLLRVRVTYTDGFGYTETLFSAPTGQVGDLWVGQAGINNVFNGTQGDDIATGVDSTGPSDGNDTLNGNGGNDVLDGRGGNDILNGGIGSDMMIGGTGNDIYVVDSLGDTVVEGAGAGTDTVQTTLNAYTLGGDLENLTFTGTGNFNGTGNALDNVMTGGAGNDALVSGDGNDTLIGGAGNDAMTGGLGNDTYIVDAVGDTVTEAVGAGTDTVRTSLGAYALGATLENLTYTGAAIFSGTGNALDNVIIGGAAADTLTGGGGNDTLDGGAGTDTMNGGAGNDTFMIRQSTDIIIEGAGAASGVDAANVFANAYVLGANVETMTFMGVGNFNGVGNGDNNVITGGAGADAIDGAGGNDTIVGGLGNDSLTGGAGDDTMIGGAGNNSFAGGGGSDTADYSLATLAVVANLGGNLVSANGFGGTDTGMTNVENIKGGSAADQLTGGNADNRIDGGLGADTLLGLGGLDMLVGGGGDDIINGGSGADSIDGGAGLDLIVQTSTEGRDFVDGGTEKDTYRLAGDATAEAFVIYTRLAAIAAIPGLVLNANTEIVVTRNGVVISELDNIEEIEVNTLGVSVGGVNGGSSAGDTITVVGDFTQTSLDFNTITIDGTAGNDTVDISQLSSAHRIVFREQGGTDTVVGTLRPQDVVIAADGTNTNANNTSAGGSIPVSSGDVAAPVIAAPAVPDAAPTGASDLLVGTDDDFIVRAAGGDDIVRGGKGDDQLYGGSGDDDLTGGEGDDLLDGGSSDDVLAGGAGDDILLGGSGDDTLNGSAGDDILTGGSGHDLFAFGDGDRITDFRAGQDHIDLSALGVTAASFATMVKVTALGGDTLIRIGDATMLLEGVAPTAIKADAFEFLQGGSGVRQTVDAKLAEGSDFLAHLPMAATVQFDVDAIAQLAPLASSARVGITASTINAVMNDHGHLPFEWDDDNDADIGSFSLHNWNWHLL